MKILVTAGPTREKIDAVRFITNRSTGKMGYAVAHAAAELGHEVVLVSGPVALSVPEGVRCIHVESAAEMAEAVHREAESAQLVVMTAAVADYRPCHIIDGKMKKQQGALSLELERTEDILHSLGRHKRPGQKLVGFAAETQDLLNYAQDKLKRKNLDWIAANDVSRTDIGFGSENNAITLLGSNGERWELGPASKLEVARQLLGYCLADFR